MEYLDELDDFAVQALAELSGGMEFPVPSTPRATTIHGSHSLLSLARPSRRHRRVPATYLLRLEPPLSTPLDVANNLGLSRVSQLEIGSGEGGSTLFCRLTQHDVDLVDAWATRHLPQKSFTKIRLGIAHRDSHRLPVLGQDPTLPHHRPSKPDLPERIGPEYVSPVYYFFYGALASYTQLPRLFGVAASELPRLKEASLLDGRVRTWANRYQALVHYPGAKVNGFMFPVASLEQEMAMRVYEGDNYEVVNARVVVDGREIVARTFRFAGFEDELSG